MQSPSPSPTPRGEKLALVFAATFPTFAAWLYFVALAQESAWLQQTAYTAGKVIQFGFPLVWVWGVGRRTAKPIRTPVRRQWSILAGLAFGLVVFAAMLAGFHLWLQPAGYFATASQPIVEKLSGFRVSRQIDFFALGLFYCVGHSFLEEYYWRWFLFGRLERHAPPAAAVVLSSVAFAAHHVIVLATYFGASGSMVLFSLGVAVGGGVWAWIYHRSGSLLGPWLSHLLVDAAIFTIAYDLIRGGMGW